MRPLEIAHLGFCVMRAAVRPVDTFLSITEDLAPLGRDVSQIAQRIYPKTVQHDPFVEAVSLSSSRFAAWCLAQRSGTQPPPSLQDILTLLKYLARLSTRSTPFGAFTVSLLGNLSLRGPTSIRIGGDEPPRLHCTLNGPKVMGIIDTLLYRDHVWLDFGVSLNPTLSTAGPYLRYWWPDGEGRDSRAAKFMFWSNSTIAHLIELGSRKPNGTALVSSFRQQFPAVAVNRCNRVRGTTDEERPYQFRSAPELYR